MLEQQLPDGAFVLGLDEHTGVILDLDADTASVVGLGVMTIRRNGVSMEIPAGTTVGIDVLRTVPDAPLVAAIPTTARGDAASGAEPDEAGPSVSLAADTARLGAEFDEAIDRRDAAAAVGATLDLEAAIVGWSTDTLQSDETDRARALLRSMIVRLGDAAVGGLTDRRTVLGPVVEVALQARLDVRAAKRYDLSDQIRDGLAIAGIEVRDTLDGQQWELLDDG